MIRFYRVLRDLPLGGRYLKAGMVFRTTDVDLTKYTVTTFDAYGQPSAPRLLEDTTHVAALAPEWRDRLLAESDNLVLTAGDFAGGTP